MSAVLRTLGKCVRETGQALDTVGLAATEKLVYLDHWSRHRQMMPLDDKSPSVAKDSFVAPNASLIGGVTVSSKASVWYGAVIRGDAGPVTIGARANLQDDVVVSGGATTIGADTTVGHSAILMAASVGPGAFVGMKAIVESATVEGGAMVAAAAVVAPGSVVPKGEVWGGNPAKFLRKMTEAEKSYVGKSAAGYAALAAEHDAEFA
ncbi:unnamed protein product, partial [Phaeothamnion confervicola]